MELSLVEAVAILSRTPRALHALLAELPEAWTLANEGEGTFSPHDVVGHLIHGEDTDWVPRIRVILEHAEAVPFEPFDRFGFRARTGGVPMGELLGLFDRRRAENLAWLQGLGLHRGDLDRRGTHPELGPVTLGQLLATWVVHDFGHLAQVARVLARQYEHEVGPWSAYLGILGPHIG